MMYVAPKIQYNTVTASNVYDELVAPAICRSTKFDWEKLSKCIPQLNKKSVPRYKRKYFGIQEVVNSPSPPLEALHVSHRTRSRQQARHSTAPPNVT